MTVPANPKIYHIVHVDNVASIVRDGFLWPDSKMVKSAGHAVIGNTDIKANRLMLPVSCHSWTSVGDYVPFYLCPRSVMLYVISKKNHQNLAFKDGQDLVVHLEADMRSVVNWATSTKRKWAFSDINAASRAADFFCDLNQLGQLAWATITSNQWSSDRDHKMAEFLVHEGFPWHLVERIGYLNKSLSAGQNEVMHKINQAVGLAAHRPKIEKQNGWYY